MNTYEDFLCFVFCFLVTRSGSGWSGFCSLSCLLRCCLLKGWAVIYEPSKTRQHYSTYGRYKHQLSWAMRDPVCVCVLHFGLSLLLNGGSFNSSSRVDSFMRTPRLCKLTLNQINISYVTTLVFVTRGWHLIYPVSSTYEVNICYSTVYLSYSIGVYQYIDVISLTIIRSKFLLFLFKVTGCAFGQVPPPPRPPPQLCLQTCHPPTSSGR